MLLPRVWLDQDETHVVITLLSRYRAHPNQEPTVDISVDSFLFMAPPYHLRLYFPIKIRDAGNHSVDYDATESQFTFRLEKMTRGEVFANFEITPELLMPPKTPQESKSLVENIEINRNGNVQSSNGNSLTGSCNPKSSLILICEDEWHSFETLQNEDMSAENALRQYKFGFANWHNDLGNGLEMKVREIVEISNQDNLSRMERSAYKFMTESIHFSEDCYLTNILLVDDIVRLLEFKLCTSSLCTLSDKNLKYLKDLGNPEIRLDKAWQKRVHLGLIDILFAYCYDWRTCEGSHTIESPWTISRLSGTLSWFEVYENLFEVVRSSFRRSISYPLYRHYDLSMKVFEDVWQVLQLGQTGVLICLLDILDLFNKREPYYLLNQLYIQEYCIWVQSVPPSNLSTITKALEKLRNTGKWFTQKSEDLQKSATNEIESNVLNEFDKDQTGFNLLCLEQAAEAVEDEEMEVELSNIVNQLDI